MTVRDRQSLKRFFRAGALPAEEQFADLIDSMLNMTDEGFRKSVEQGYEISAAAGYDVLLSFFRDQDPEAPLWDVGFSGAEGQLQFRARRHGEDRPAPVYCLDPAGRAGVNTASPQATLDVEGEIRSRGRVGSYPPPSDATLLADGQWHDLTGDLEGCQAFEVVAGAGRRGSGRFALLHAVALNTYNPRFRVLDLLRSKRGIRSTHAFFARRCDRLQLRWSGSSGRDACYRLQIRSGCDYGRGASIQAHLTQLWFDRHMEREQPHIGQEAP